MALDWDLLNEDCAGIADWTDADTGSCVSEQVTFDSQSTFKFTCPSTSADTTTAYRYRVITVPDTFTAEWVGYITSEDSYGSLYCFFYTTGSHVYAVRITSTHIGIMTSVAQAYTYIDAPTGLSSWHTYRLVVKASRKVDFWVDGICYVASLSCATTTVTPNYVVVRNYADNISTLVAYIDYIKIDTTPEAPTTTSALKINNQEIAYRYAQAGGLLHDTPSKLRFRGGKAVAGGSDVTLEIPLVATTDTNASKVRIYDGSAVKSLLKLPA